MFEALHQIVETFLYDLLILHADDVLLLSEEFEFTGSGQLLSLKFFIDVRDVDRLATT